MEAHWEEPNPTSVRGKTSVPCVVLPIYQSMFGGGGGHVNRREGRKGGEGEDREEVEREEGRMEQERGRERMEESNENDPM